jgi:hypothetical protein
MNIKLRLDQLEKKTKGKFVFAAVYWRCGANEIPDHIGPNGVAYKKVPNNKRSNHE